jgi:hypothetical protein
MDVYVCIARILALPTILALSPQNRLMSLLRLQVVGAENYRTNSLSCALYKVNQCVAPHYGSRLHVQVAHHGVTMPATQHANVVRVDLTTE